MSKTNLVLLTGFPAVGKSTVAQRLASEYNFTILSADDLRQSFFKQDYGELVKDGKVREEIIRKIMDYSKLQFLGDGYDLVVDTSAPTEKFRRRMLDLPKSLEDEVQKSILYVKSNDPIIYKRQTARGQSEEAIQNISRLWSEPQKGFMGATLYEMENNGSHEDLYEKLDGFYRGLKS